MTINHISVYLVHGDAVPIKNATITRPDDFTIRIEADRSIWEFNPDHVRYIRMSKDDQ